MCRAGLMVTIWMAISGARPDWMASLTLWSVAPSRIVSEQERSSVVNANWLQSSMPAAISPFSISGNECGRSSMNRPRRSLSSTSSAVQASWSEAMPAAAKALIPSGKMAVSIVGDLAKIKADLGLVHEHGASEMSRYAKVLKGCDDMDLRVGIDTVLYRRTRMAGLQAVHDTVKEIEKACRGNPA